VEGHNRAIEEKRIILKWVLGKLLSEIQYKIQNKDEITIVENNSHVK